MQREKVVGKAMLKIGLKHSTNVIKRSFSSKEKQEEIKEQNHKEIAKVIFDSLGHLKGVPVKIAQQVALGMPFLPPKYLEKISQSFNAIPPIKQSNDEIQTRLEEEVDYELEATNTQFFATHLKKNILIPNIIEEFSSQKVLSLNFLEGDDFESFIKSNPTQKTRDAYAQLIFDTFFVSLYKLKCIHADPNPGNFIFMKDGKLGFIDFGCAKKATSFCS